MEPKLKRLMQIGIIVRDLGMAVKHYQAMGIGPWELWDMRNDQPPFEDLTFDDLEAHFGGVVDSFGFAKPDVDAYIDCAGAGPILEQIVSMAKKNARIAIVAIYHKPVELNAAGFLSSELTMKGSCGYQFPDVIEAFQNVNSHCTQIARIVTHHFPHEQSVEAFQTAADRSSGAIKVVIDYDI